MDENNEMFNQKLMEIGGGEILEGISIRGKDKEKILEFINANTGYEYGLDSKNMLTKITDDLKFNSDVGKKRETFLDIQIRESINQLQKIIISFETENIQTDLCVYKNGNSRIIKLNANSYIIANRYNKKIDTDNENKLQVDNLYNEALTDKLIKALHDTKIIQTRSSTSTIGIMGTDTTVYHGPDATDYATVGSVNQNESVYLLATSKGWYHIEYNVTSTGKHKTGYVHASSVSSISGNSLIEEDFYGGFCFATTELDVRTCDIFSLTAPVGTLYKHEGCTLLFCSEVNGNNIAFIEYATSSGTKRGYVYSKYLSSPLKTIVGIVKESINVYGGPDSNYAKIGALGAGELVSVLAKEGNNIYVEYNTNSRKKKRLYNMGQN